MTADKKFYLTVKGIRYQDLEKTLGDLKKARETNKVKKIDKIEALLASQGLMDQFGLWDPYLHAQVYRLIRKVLGNTIKTTKR